MKVQISVLDEIAAAGAKALIVTKYFNRDDTWNIYEQVREHPAFFALGERRIDDIIEKDLPREHVHFIGNIQSRKIPVIAHHCSVVHSLCEIKHAVIMSEQLKPSVVFVQVNISGEVQKLGMLPRDLEGFLRQMGQFSNIQILGISAMGAAEFTPESKREEFRILKKLRDEQLPERIISAGTSRDYKIALEEGINVVRIGQALFRPE